MLDKIFQSKSMKIVWLIYALFSVGLILYLANNMICKDYDKISQKTIIDEGWTIEIDGEIS